MQRGGCGGAVASASVACAVASGTGAIRVGEVRDFGGRPVAGHNGPMTEEAA